MSWGGQEQQGKHQSMITLEEHKRITSIMASHNQHACRRRKYNYLLRGFVFCGICGRRYTAGKHKNKTIEYYHCGAPSKNHSNEGQNIEVGKLEQMISDKFKDIQFTPSFVSLVIKKIKRFYDGKVAHVNKDKRGLLNKKMGIEKNVEIAEGKLISGTLNDSGFVRINTRFEAEIKAIDKQIQELEKKRRVDIDTIRTVLLFTKSVYKVYKKSSPRVKRLYLSLFWEGQRGIQPGSGNSGSLQKWHV